MTKIPKTNLEILIMSLSNLHFAKMVFSRMFIQTGRYASLMHASRPSTVM